MAAQVEQGHEVAYFLSGRHYPLLRRPRLRRWRRNGVAMYEAINGPIPFEVEKGTRYPDHDLSDPWFERTFAGVLEELGPEVVHVQELAGLPSSLLEVAEAAGVPVLMTLQDYFPLCSTVRLYDSDGAVCLRRDVGEDCVATNAAAPANTSPLVSQTMNFELQRGKQLVPGVRRINFAAAAPVIEPSVAAAARVLGSLRGRRGNGQAAVSGAAPPEAYQRRRDVNLARLRRVSGLVAPSRRVAEIYRTLGVDGGNVQHVPLTVAHLEHLRPRTLCRAPQPVTFATLGGCNSPSKGVDIVLDALRRLADVGVASDFRLRVYGTVHPPAMRELKGHPSVVLQGYVRGSLSEILDDVDVGVLPSLWEDCYPFSGLEFLAKGIPLLANSIGGIVDYAREGETGWLNRSRSGKELAELMLQIIREPGHVLDLHKKVVGLRDELIKPMPRHAQEMEELYGALT